MGNILGNISNILGYNQEKGDDDMLVTPAKSTNKIVAPGGTPATVSTTASSMTTVGSSSTTKGMTNPWLMNKDDRPTSVNLNEMFDEADDTSKGDITKMLEETLHKEYFPKISGCVEVEHILRGIFVDIVRNPTKYAHPNNKESRIAVLKVQCELPTDVKYLTNRYNGLNTHRREAEGATAAVLTKEQLKEMNDKIEAFEDCIFFRLYLWCTLFLSQETLRVDSTMPIEKQPRIHFNVLRLLKKMKKGKKGGDQFIKNRLRVWLKMLNKYVGGLPDFVTERSLDDHVTGLVTFFRDAEATQIKWDQKQESGAAAAIASATNAKDMTSAITAEQQFKRSLSPKAPYDANHRILYMIAIDFANTYKVPTTTTKNDS